MSETLQSYQGKIWKWEERGFKGQVELLNFDENGNPVWKHTFQTNKWGISSRYFHWYTCFSNSSEKQVGHWLETTGTSLSLKGGVEQQPDSPFPKVKVNCRGNSGIWKQVGIGLDRCFQKMEMMKNFVGRGSEKKETKFLFLLILCKRRWIKDTGFNGNIPLEIIYLITTFLRLVDTSLETEFLC